MAIIFDKANQIIEVEAPATEVTIQALLNAIREYEDELINSDIPLIAQASGKEQLSDILYVGITLTLIDWKLKFADRGSPTLCDVNGGNLVAYDTGLSEYVNPIEPSSNVTVTKTASSSATLIEGGGSGLSQEEHDKLYQTNKLVKTIV